MGMKAYTTEQKLEIVQKIIRRATEVSKKEGFFVNVEVDLATNHMGIDLKKRKRGKSTWLSYGYINFKSRWRKENEERCMEILDKCERLNKEREF